MNEELFIKELFASPELYMDGIRVLKQDILIRLIPVFLSFMITMDGVRHIAVGRKKSVRYAARGLAAILIAVVLLAFHVGVYFLEHFLIMESWDVDGTISIIAKVWYKYQDYEYVGGGLLISTAAGLILGHVIRRLVIWIADKANSSFGTKTDQDVINVHESVSCKMSAILRTAEMLITSGLLLLCITLLYKGYTGVNHLVINEVCSNNFSTAINEDYDVCDYVELYNVGEHACATDGVYLSDDPVDLQKLQVRDFVIPNFSYAAIPVKDEFGISRDGDTIYLSDEFGNIIDSVEIPPMDSDASYSRVINGFDEWAIMGCTPGRDNAYSVNRINMPAFSREAGFYDDEFYLELSSDINASIYYTLDGSEPTMESSLYTEPIHIYDRSSEDNVLHSVVNVVERWQEGIYEPDAAPVDKAMVVRAIAIYDDRNISDICTKTYFVNLPKYKENPVISLAGSPYEIFGDDGIYVTGSEYDAWYDSGCPEDTYVYPNFKKHDRNHEVKVSAEYFDKDSRLTQYAGLRIQGDGSCFNPTKNLSIISRKEYSGSNYFPREYLGTEYSHSLTLRGGCANSMYQELADGLDIAHLDYKNVSVFLNGEFWYNCSLLEKYNKGFFAEHYGAQPDNVMVYKDSVMEDGAEGEEELMGDFAAYVREHDLTDETTYDEFCQMVDIQSYIDLMCFYAYIGHTDRRDFSHNDIMWKVRVPEDNQYLDGRWRWAAFDLDPGDDIEMQMADSDNIQNVLSGEMFSELIQNERFRKQFMESLRNMTENIITDDKIVQAVSRFGFETDNCKAQYDDRNVKTLKEHEQFLKERRQYIVRYVEECVEK